MGAVSDILASGGYGYIKNPREASMQPPAAAGMGFDALVGLLGQGGSGGGGMGFTGGGGAYSSPIYGQGAIDELIWQAPDHYDHLHFAGNNLPMHRIARKLERRGFDVGELEGFGGQGQISSGHTTNSTHYRGTGMDVNYRGGGRWGNETQALDWLADWLARKYG